MSVASTRSAGPPPEVARELFGDRLPLAQRYAGLLATDGIDHGLVGPRELDRIWTRHLLNCAVVAELLPTPCRLVDIGSGAGLPGLVLACARPDVQVQLVEPLLRRVNFLENAVILLGLSDQVTVLRGRADDREIVRQAGRASWVTARAVAPLDRLVGWCLPLLAPGGTLLALKGANAADEVAAVSAGLPKTVARPVELVQCGTGMLDEPTRVVVVRRT